MTSAMKGGRNFPRLVTKSDNGGKGVSAKSNFITQKIPRVF